MKTINVTILAVQGSVARAYLGAMKAKGLAPKKIIDLRVKPKGVKYRLLTLVLGKKISYELFSWQARRRFNTSRNKELCESLMANSDYDADFFGKMSYRDYASEVEVISVESLSDPVLAEGISKQDCKTFVFTGGGILREGLLRLPGVRFLHVHPGVTPEVKGSDGIFWSLLVKSKPGYSCFYMNEGIDTGDIVETKEFERPCLSASPTLYSYEMLYRGILNFYDPWLRACLLVDVLCKFESMEDLNKIPALIQDPEEGRTYYFMHPKIRNNVIKSILA